MLFPQKFLGFILARVKKISRMDSEFREIIAQQQPYNLEFYAKES